MYGKAREMEREKDRERNRKREKRREKLRKRERISLPFERYWITKEYIDELFLAFFSFLSIHLYFHQKKE